MASLSCVSSAGDFTVRWQPTVAKVMYETLTISWVCESVALLSTVIFPEIAKLKALAETISSTSNGIVFVDIVNTFFSLHKWYNEDKKSWTSSVIMISSVARHVLINASILGIDDFGTIATSIGNIPLFELSSASLRIICFTHIIWEEYGKIKELNEAIGKAQLGGTKYNLTSLLNLKANSYNKILDSINHVALGVIRLASLYAGTALFGPALAALGSVCMTTYSCYVLFSKNE